MESAVKEERMNDRFFAKIDRQKVAACYLDWAMIAADFEAPLENVLKIMSNAKLKPLQAREGFVQVRLMGMSYRQIDNLEPYNEFGVLIPVAPLEDDADPRTPIYYIAQLPVTTQQACDGGVFFYGYPKFVAQIRFEIQDDITSCSVKDDDQEIVSLQVASLPTTLRSLDFYTYSIKDDKVLKTWIQVEGQSGISEGQPAARYQLRQQC